MKRLLFTVIFVFGCFMLAIGQTNQDVSFVHGLNGDISSLNYMDNQLSQLFIFNSDNVSYNDHASIPTAASNTYFPYNTVTVAHSLGGLLSREYLDQQGSSYMKSLITLGTPNIGAPVAENVQNGAVANVAAGWLNDLAAGPVATFGSFFGRQFARNVVEALGTVSYSGGFLLAAYLDYKYSNIASVNDMKPGSYFLNTLNDNPYATLPASRYAIFGDEDFYDYVRLADDALGIENYSLIRIHHNATAFYFIVSGYYAYIAFQYLVKYLNAEEWDPDRDEYYANFQYFLYLARQWARGFVSLVLLQQIDWDQRVVGVDYFVQNDNLFREYSDGLLPASTVAPSFFGSVGSRILRARHANHLELKTHPNVERRLAEIFKNIGIKRKDTGDPTDPYPEPQPCSEAPPGEPCVLQ